MGEAISGWAWLQGLAAASGLLVAALAGSQGAKSQLALPLFLLAAEQVLVNLGSLGLALTGAPAYEWVGMVAAMLFPPPMLHFVLAFVGRRLAYPRLLRAVYVLFVGLGLVAALDAWAGWGLASVPAYSLLLLGTGGPLIPFTFVQIARHLRSPLGRREAWQSWVLAVSLAVALALLITDLLADQGLPVPRLASLGTFTFTAVMTYLLLGLQLLPVGRPLASAAQGVLLALLGATVALALLTVLQGRWGALTLAVSGLSLVGVTAARLVGQRLAADREALQRSAVLGRFSAQLAHDLKNPLAAAKGAAELLEGELAAGRPVKDGRYVELIAAQLQRIHRVVDRYQRLARLEPELESLDVAELLAAVAQQARLAAPEVELDTELPTPPPALRADKDLLASALENLVRNAVEAMGGKGSLTLGARLERRGDRGSVHLTVADRGPGVDPRVREELFELFTTTKASGSGLGLAFVRAVAEAHGGGAALHPRPGGGTLAELWLPSV